MIVIYLHCLIPHVPPVIETLLVCIPGVLQVFDLGQKCLRPVATVEQDTGGQCVLCVEFNQQQLLAVGNADGTVNIWQLSAEFTEQRPRESAILQQLADDVPE